MMPVPAPYRLARLPISAIACMLNDIGAQRLLALDMSCRLWQNLNMPHASTAETDPVEQLALRYSVEDHAAVRDFLKRNPDVLPVLMDAPEAISQAFPMAGLDIEVSSDPESGHRYLVVWISSRMGVEKAIDSLLELTSDWWGDARRGLGERLVLCIE